MTNSLNPFSFVAGVAVLGNETPGWNFDSEEGGERTFRHYIAFQSPFLNPPLVHVGIAGFDIGNADAARVTVSAANVTPAGFEVVLGTWMHSRLWRVDVSWLALGA